MIGAVIGDIAGSVYEWNNIKTKEFTIFGWHGGKRCHFTDDTVMTMAVAKAVLVSRDDRSDLSENAAMYLQLLARSYPGAGYGRRFREWMYSDDPQPYWSFGNGSAMRVSPVAYAARDLDDALAMSDAVTRVTHDHPEGLKGARAVTACIWLALHGGTKEEIRDLAEKEYYELNRTLDEIRPRYEFRSSCQESVPQAIEAFLESEDFEDAIRNAISIGGDSDTIAAIAGSIAEAYYGAPDGLREKAEERLDPELLGILRDFEDRYPAKRTGQIS